jgi:hypothetical protein
MHPKEYAKMGSNIDLLFEQYSPQERERLKRDWLEVLKKVIPKMGRDEPEELGAVLAEIDPKTLGQALGNLEASDLGRALAELPEEQEGALIEYLAQLLPEKRERLLKRLEKKTQN